MKTIGVDIRVFSTGRTSGIEEYTEQLLAHMIPLGRDVQWKLLYGGRRVFHRYEWMSLPNVVVHETGRSNRALWLSTRLTGRPYLDTLVGGADVFFFPHFLLGALTPSCRRVMTWHDLSYEHNPEMLSVHRRFWHALQMRPRTQAMACDRIISVSDSTAVDLTGMYGIDASRIAVIPSGVDESLRRASEPAILHWRQQTGIDGPFVLALGTREPRKNLPALVRAWDIVRRQPGLGSLGLVIAGQPGWMEHELAEAIASVREPGAIRCIEHIDRAERSLLLSSASMLVYPSFMEGFGFPPLEAMACGTPVIAGATSSLLETVGDAGLLVDPCRIDDLVAAMSALLRDAGLRSRFVALGYDRVGRFSWSETARMTLSEIVSVL